MKVLLQQLHKKLREVFSQDNAQLDPIIESLMNAAQNATLVQLNDVFSEIEAFQQRQVTQTDMAKDPHCQHHQKCSALLSRHIAMNTALQAFVDTKATLMLLPDAFLEYWKRRAEFLVKVCNDPSLHLVGLDYGQDSLKDELYLFPSMDYWVAFIPLAGESYMAHYNKTSSVLKIVSNEEVAPAAAIDSFNTTDTYIAIRTPNSIYESTGKVIMKITLMTNYSFEAEALNLAACQKNWDRYHRYPGLIEEYLLHMEDSVNAVLKALPELRGL